MKKGNIVLVEDDKILSKVVYEELSDAGFDVSNAYDGEEALKVIQSAKPDLILLDLVLPKKHGFDVLEQLKQSPDTKEIPVIIITMLGSDDDIKKGIQLGADDYIVKAQHAVAEIVEKVSEFFDRMHDSEAKII